METDLTTMVVGSVARHALTGIAGSLVTAGAVQHGDEGSFVKIGTGIALWAAAVGWSWWQKKGHAFVVAKMSATIQGLRFPGVPQPVSK